MTDQQITNPLWKDIQAQGDNLLRVIEHLYGPERRRIEQAAASLRNDRPIALIGMGSAQYLCYPAESYLGEQGRFTSALFASDALYSVLPSLRQANVVINSRSGETIEIVRLAEALGEAGIPYTAITNEPESALARSAAHVVWSNTHKDDLVSINVVTAMMTATLVLAAAVVGQMDALRPDFEGLGQAISEVVRQSWAMADRMLAHFDATRPIYLLGRGASKGAALCGRLVLEEVARWPAVALDAADFRQGAIEVVDHRFGAIIFTGTGKQEALNRALGQNLLDSGGSILFVGSSPRESERALSISIPDLPDALRPVLEVVPLQILAYKLAEQQGYPPGQTRYIAKIITTEEGLPKDAMR